MKSEIVIKPHLIYIEHEKEFAILERSANENGFQQITFSHEITTDDVDIIDNSGMAEVQQYKKDGILVFRRFPFYETHLMVEIITNILKRHEE